MTTNYDPIAEQYKRAKEQPWRAHIASHGLSRRNGPLSSPNCDVFNT